jgi:lauroyl/myristoyl acyltransferase
MVGEAQKRGGGAAARLGRLALAPDGRPRPEAPFGRGPLAAHVLGQVIRLAAALGGRVPAETAHALAAAGGHAEWALRSGKRAVLEENLAHATGLGRGDPALRAAVRREIVNEARRSADLLWSVHDPEAVVRRTRLEGMEHLDAVIDGGRGAVVVGPHVGGWEIASPVSRFAARAGVTVFARDDWLAWAIARTRTAAGLEVVYTSEPAIGVIRRLRAGRLIFTLGDAPVPGVRTAIVRLLDAPIELPVGPVTLARLAGAPLLSWTVLPIAPRAWLMQFSPPLPPPPRDGGLEGERAALQALADVWSEVLRAHPDQWAAVYPLRWLDERR